MPLTLAEYRTEEDIRRWQSAVLGNTIRLVGKHFHTVEVSFPRTERAWEVPFSNGRENFRPRRWYPSAWVIRVARARRVRAARGRAAVAAKGALGISSRTCAALGNERRTATKAPPALILSAVANSRNSFPFSSRLRTNTGIAKGRRAHFRRSFSGLRRIKVSSLSHAIYTFWVASNGPNADIQRPLPFSTRDPGPFSY